MCLSCNDLFFFSGFSRRACSFFLVSHPVPITSLCCGAVQNQVLVLGNRFPPASLRLLPCLTAPSQSRVWKAWGILATFVSSRPSCPLLGGFWLFLLLLSTELVQFYICLTLVTIFFLNFLFPLDSFLIIYLIIFSILSWDTSNPNLFSHQTLFLPLYFLFWLMILPSKLVVKLKIYSLCPVFYLVSSSAPTF